MLSEQHASSKRPVSAVLAGPYGHPFHPILVTVPIGSWVASLVFDIASQFATSPGFLTEGSEWLIALGVLGALAAACVGFLDFFTIPAGTTAYRTAVLHMALNIAVTAAYVAGFLWRHSTATHNGPVGAGQLALSVASLATLTISGALGGRLAYRFGVRVVEEAAQAPGFTTID